MYIYIYIYMSHSSFIFFNIICIFIIISFGCILLLLFFLLFLFVSLCIVHLRSIRGMCITSFVCLQYINIIYMYAYMCGCMLVYVCMYTYIFI